MRGLVKRRRKWWVQFVPCPGAKIVRVSTGKEDEAEAIVEARRIKERYRVEVRESLFACEAEIANFLTWEKRKGLAAATLNTRHYVLKGFVEKIGAPSPNRITPDAVDRWFQSLRGDEDEGVHTALYYLQIVGQWFAWMVERGKLPTNPASTVKKPTRVKRRRRRVFLLPAESKKFLDQCTVGDFPKRLNGQKAQRAARIKYLQCALWCALHAGFRFNEVVEAHPAWFDTDAGLTHIQGTDTFRPKDLDDRTIPMTDEFRAFLIEYKKGLPEGAKFMIAPDVKHGKARYRYDFSKSYEAHAKALGFDHVTFHDLRRTFASQLVSAGVSIYKVAKWLGDLVSVVEERYGHLIPQDKDINLLTKKPNTDKIDAP